MESLFGQDIESIDNKGQSVALQDAFQDSSFCKDL
jgi:hypothetical protein